MADSTARDWPSIAAEDAERFDLDAGTEADPDLRAFWESGPSLLQEMSSRLDWQAEAGQTVVEVGCGAGRLTRPLATTAGRVFALDAPERIAEAAARNPALENVTWISDLESLPAAVNGAVDGFVVYSALLGADVPAACSLIAPLSRVLSPGGWGLLQADDRIRPMPGSAVFGNALRRLSQALIGRQGLKPTEMTSTAGVDLGRIEQLAGSHGLRRERAVGKRSQHCLALFRKER